jgi:dATP/dGTP diphosphohydrolase
VCEGCPRDERSPDGMINHNCKLCRELRYHEEHVLDGESKDTNPKDAIAGTKPALWLVPPALRIIAEPAMRLGGEKYGPFNWREKGVKYNVYLDALERHMTAIREGQDIDPESGFTHLSHMAACVAIMADAMYIGKLIDDRPIAGGGVKLMEEISERYRK